MLKGRQYSKSTSNLLDESDSEQNLDILRQQEEQRLKEKLSKININQLCSDYNQQGLVMSDLTFTRYKSLFQSNVSLLPVLPKIDPNVLQDEVPQKQQYSQQLIPKKKSLFLNQNEIKHLKGQMLDKLENDLYEYQSKLFKRRRCQMPRSRLSSLNSNISLTSSQLTNADQEIQLTLNHNKGVLLQHKRQDQQNLKKQLNFITSNQDYIPNKKQAKIRSFPMKTLDEVLAIEERQTIIIQQNDDDIPIQYSYWVDIEMNSWRPRMREGFSFNKIGRKLILYGGINSQKMNDVVEYDFQSNRWKECETSGEKPQFGRNNHSGNNYKKIIYIFGGEKSYDENSRTRECLNDFKMLNIEIMEWKTLKINGDSIEGRRGHASCMLGKKLMIFGGINTKGFYLNSLYHLDINNLKLTNDTPLSSTYFVDGIAFHTLTPVYFRNNSSLYKSPNQDIDEDNKIKQQGLYLFGGENTHGKYYETLFILITDSRPLQWIKPDCKGISPCSRIRHAASYIDFLNIYILFGGFSQQGLFLGDLHILRTDKLCWCNVIINQRQSRAGHQVVVDDRRLYIFGGYNEKGYLKGDLDCLELDNRIAQKLHKVNQVGINPTIANNQDNQQSQNQKQQKIKQQVQLLNYKNQNSFLPMPQLVIKVENRRLTQIQVQQLEKIKEETSKYVQNDQPTRKKNKKTIIKQ